MQGRRRRVFSAKMTRCKVRILARVFSWQGTTDNDQTRETTQKVVVPRSSSKKYLKCAINLAMFQIVLCCEMIYFGFAHFWVLAYAVWICQQFLIVCVFSQRPP